MTLTLIAPGPGAEPVGGLLVSAELNPSGVARVVGHPADSAITS